MEQLADINHSYDLSEDKHRNCKNTEVFFMSSTFMVRDHFFFFRGKKQFE